MLDQPRSASCQPVKLVKLPQLPPVKVFGHVARRRRRRSACSA